MIISPGHHPAAGGYQAAVPSRSDGADPAGAAEKASAGPAAVDEGLAPEELRLVRELAARDREVRAHEQAHLSAAGGLARGGASFVFQRGPDQRNYAVGGEVQIDTAAVAGDPHATLRKAEQIQRAALAPAQPSGQDRAVAADAAAMAADARMQILRNAREENAGTAEGATAQAADQTTGNGTDAAAGGAPGAAEAAGANHDDHDGRNRAAATAITAYARHADNHAPTAFQGTIAERV